MKSSHSFWAKDREAKGAIDLDKPFNDYWSSNEHDFIALGQSLSPIGVCRPDREEQSPFSLGNIEGL